MIGKAAILGLFVYSGSLAAPVPVVDGAEEARPHKKWSRDQTSYKKGHRDRISVIAGGNVEQAIEWFDDYLVEHPGDLEALYGLALGHARQGDVDTAMSYVERAVDGGLPFERFLAGPRDLLAPLVSSRAFRKYRSKRRVELLHGPMLGSVTHEGARFWFRTASEKKVRVRVSASRAMTDAIETRAVRTRKERDFTAVAAVEGLRPDTRYFYEVRIQGKPVSIDPPPSFRTFRPPGESGSLRVGFGGGAGYTPWNERMWDTLAEHDLPLFLMLGDNVYIDAPTVPETQRYCYYRRFSRPEWRRFVASTSIHAIWDDHDFATNETISGPGTDVPEWKRDVWHVFKENWNNPTYGGGEEQPGVWHRFSVGDVDFFMLDGRYYRTDPEIQRPSMLGPVQKRWLLEELAESRATFKVLASPVPWAAGTKIGIAGTGRPRAWDTWDGYPDEREEILRFIEEKRIEGVVLISADRHRSDSWKIPRDDGYTLYDWISSRLTNHKFHRPVESEYCLFSYYEEPAFGLLTFETESSDPTVTYEVVNVDGEVVETQTLKRSELSE
jgi:alkaline phosphatase D